MVSDTSCLASAIETLEIRCHVRVLGRSQPISSRQVRFDRLRKLRIPVAEIRHIHWGDVPCQENANLSQELLSVNLGIVGPAGAVDFRGSCGIRLSNMPVV